MKQVRSLFCLAFAVGLVFGQPLMVLAQEHAGKEHAGGATAGGGTEVAPAAAQDDSKATLTEAATALEVTDPVLSAELKDWANGMGLGDKKAALTKAATALEASKPELAAKLKALAEK